MSELSAFPGDERRGAVRYVHAIRQHWLLVTLLVAGSVAIAYVFVSTAVKRYEASVDIVISPVSANDDTFQGLTVFRQSLE